MLEQFGWHFGKSANRPPASINALIQKLSGDIPQCATHCGDGECGQEDSKRPSLCLAAVLLEASKLVSLKSLSSGRQAVVLPSKVPTGS